MRQTRRHSSVFYALIALLAKAYKRVKTELSVNLVLFIRFILDQGNSPTRSYLLGQDFYKIYSISLCESITIVVSLNRISNTPRTESMYFATLKIHHHQTKSADWEV